MAVRGSSVSIDDYLWPNRYLLEICGLWPKDFDGQTFATQLSISFRLCFAITSIITGFLLPEILMIIVYWGDISVLTEVGCVATPVSLILFKFIYMGVCRKRSHMIYAELTKLWSDIDDSKELEILEKLADLVKFVTIAYTFSGLCNVFSFATVSAIDWINYDETRNDSHRNLPFEAWYGFDTVSTPNFEIIFVWQFISSLYCCAGIVGIDCTMMAYVLHICGHFRIMAVRLRVIGHKILDDEKCLKSVQVVSIKKEINHIFEQYSEMLRLAEEVRCLLGPIIFMQLLTSGLEICLCVYALTMVDNTAANMFKFFCVLTSMFVEMIIWCWPGQLLMQDSSALGDVICYEVPWRLLTVTDQRDFAFFIMRTKKECQLTALSFQVVSMNKFTEIFKSAGSYFALLRTMNEKQMKAY